LSIKGRELERMAIRWDEFPHHEIRLKIHARLAPNGVGRAAEDSKLHILRRQLSFLRHEDHGRFVELQARHLVEHLRCTRDVYREFVDSKGCRPVLEAQWVVLRFAVLPTAIAILRQKVIEYAKLTGVRGRDITLLFGIITASCSRKADQTPGEPFRFLQPPDLDDETPATDEELESLAQLIDEDRLVVLEDIRDGGSVFRFHGGGPFSVDDYGSIHLSFEMCGLIHAGISLPDWVSIRKRLWNLGTPWTEGLCGLFGAVQEELMSQWRSLPLDSLAHNLNENPSFQPVVVPANEKLPAGRKLKRPDRFVRYAGMLWQDAISEGKTRVSYEQLRQIASALDTAGHLPPSAHLEGKCAQELKAFNSRNSKSKIGSVKTWSQLVSLGDKDYLRGMRRLLSRCAEKLNDDHPLSGN
jgi:hypothetical protein